MTVGQRIAQKRKELGLSQEGLGDRLGVSRQAIYKWESDAALPEIEKLVNLSREFSVSIDWLLGQEDESREPRELTAEQLRMVEEIVERYLDARPPEHTVIPRETAEPEGDGQGEDTPEPPKGAQDDKKPLPWFLGLALKALVAIAALNVAVLLFWRLGDLEERFHNLQSSITYVREDVNSQINSITRRVEEVLQSQNALTAEQSAQVAETDCRANTVTVEVRAVPRTFVEGMTAEFTLVSGGEPVTVPGELGENHAFTARITAPLTDEITVSAAFLSGDQRQTQVLEEFNGLYTMSFPGILITGGMSGASKTQGDPAWTVSMRPVDVDCYDQQNGGPARLNRLRVGLFRDQKLVQWLTEEEQDGYIGSHHFRLEEETILMDIGHTYCVAAVAEDEFGREWVVTNQSVYYDAVEDSLRTSSLLEFSQNPADWAY